jgi:hypothetical protein
VDADYGGDVATRRSTTGYAFMLFGACVTWQSVKINQSVFTARVLGLICDSEARTAIDSDGQHIGASQELQAVNALRELLGIL